MTDETRQILWDITKLSIVGTAISFPLGLWLLPKARRGEIDTWVVPVVFTGVGLWLKHVMLNSRPALKAV